MTHFFVKEGNILTPIKMSRPYSAEAKQFALAMYANYRSTQSIAQIARLLGMPESTLKRWITPIPSPTTATLF